MVTNAIYFYLLLVTIDGVLGPSKAKFDPLLVLMDSTEEARLGSYGNPQLLKVCVRDERTLSLSIMRCKQFRIVSLKTVNEELLKGCLRVYPIT